MFKWRPILRGICTLKEYDQHYSIKDLLDANEALDVLDEHETWAHKQQEKQVADARG